MLADNIGIPQEFIGNSTFISELSNNRERRLQATHWKFTTCTVHYRLPCHFSVFAKCSEAKAFQQRISEVHYVTSIRP